MVNPSRWRWRFCFLLSLDLIWEYNFTSSYVFTKPIKTLTETSTIYGRLKKSQAFSLLLWMPEPRVWAAPGTCNPSLPELLYSLWAYSCHNQPTLRCQKKLPCETGCSYAEDVALHTKNHRRNFLGFSTSKSYASKINWLLFAQAAGKLRARPEAVLLIAKCPVF